MNQSVNDQDAARSFAIRRRDFSILVAQSEVFNCEVLSQLLKEQGYNVVGRAVELDDTIQQIRVKRPECVILESEMSGRQSFDIIPQIRETNQKTKFILYTSKPDLRQIASAMQLAEQTREELSRLTDREREVLKMVANGYTADEIAGQLGISYRTVINHKSHMARKLDLDGCRQLPRYGIAVRNHL